MWDAGKVTKAYAIFFDLSDGQKITDVAKFDSEYAFVEFIKSLKDKFIDLKYVEVGIKTSNGVVEEITFDALKARLFQK